jgi:RNA polymerase sigma-70 factor (ECF subfamily)
VISEVIVKRAKNGDEEAFANLYESVYKDMYRMAYYMLGRKEDAEDAVAEAVLDMYRYIQQLKRADSFKSWAMKILWVKCKLKMKEYTRECVELDAVGEQSDDTDIANVAMLKKDLKGAMESLNDEERIIVISSSIAGLNCKEISKLLGINHGTVRSKLCRALQKIRVELEEYV